MLSNRGLCAQPCSQAIPGAEPEGVLAGVILNPKTPGMTSGSADFAAHIYLVPDINSGGMGTTLFGSYDNSGERDIHTHTQDTDKHIPI